MPVMLVWTRPLHATASTQTSKQYLLRLAASLGYTHPLLYTPLVVHKFVHKHSKHCSHAPDVLWLSKPPRLPASTPKSCPLQPAKATLLPSYTPASRPLQTVLL